MSAGDLFAEGKLAEALVASIDEVKKNPAEAGLRWRFAELLCFAGDFERADNQIQTLLTQFPKLATNAVLFRQLIRAEVARQQLLTDGRLPELLIQPTESIQKCLEIVVHTRGGDEVMAAECSQAAEELRFKPQGSCNGVRFDDLRDLDDLTSSVLEVFAGDGKYLWVPFAKIQSIQFHKPERPRDLLWRSATLKAEALRANVFIPALYSGTCRESDENLRLGRLTNWKGSDTGPAFGLGQKMWLVGEQQLSLMEISEIQFDATESS